MIIFKDIYETQIKVSISSSGYLRLDFEGDSFIPSKHSKTGLEIPLCISMTENQARILINSLEDLLDKLNNE